jgi:endonuclease/exonuclease/phosphatase family metal-dependent hydrolase
MSEPLRAIARGGSLAFAIRWIDSQFAGTHNGTMRIRVRMVSVLLSLPMSLLISLLFEAPALAADVPLDAERLAVRALPGGRNLIRFQSRDPRIRQLTPEPGDGSSLVIGDSAMAGRCRLEIPLDSAKWRRIGGVAGPPWYLYWDVSAGRFSYAMIRPSGISLMAWGLGLDCDFSGPQPLPVAVDLRLGSDRYCASFEAGDVQQNTTGRLIATHSSAPASCMDNDLTVVNLNVLHGVTCPGQCRTPDRVALLADWIVERGCPDVVTLQEVVDHPNFESIPALLSAELQNVCPFQYQMLFEPYRSGDEELVLSRYPVVDWNLEVFHPGRRNIFRHALHARIDHPIGLIDVFTTHLASGADNGSDICFRWYAYCPPECVAAGARTVRTCQAVQLFDFVERVRQGPAPTIVTGDFNAEPGSFEYDIFTDNGYVDTYLEAGNPECDSTNPYGCTTGRESNNLSELESPLKNQHRRIDYIFRSPSEAGSVCSDDVDGSEDLDQDVSATGSFDPVPNPFASSCGPQDEICWISDHGGVELDLNCQPLPDPPVASGSLLDEFSRDRNWHRGERR